MKIGVFGKSKLSEIFIHEFKNRYEFPALQKVSDCIVTLCDKEYLTPGDVEFTYENVKDLNFLYLPIGYKSRQLKSNKYSQAKEWEAVTPSWISKEALVLNNSTSLIKEASWVMSGAIIGVQSSVGVGSTIWSGCNLSHHCKVGDFSWVSPGAILLGESTVGSNCFIGAGSIIGEGVEVSDNCFVGAGAVITKNIPENSVVLEGKNNIIHKGDRFAVSSMYERLK